jgi:hypothetical protein
MCPHGGSVQAIPSGTSVTAVSPVLTAADTFLIAGCSFIIGIVPSPCLSVQWVQPGTGSTLRGNPTLTLSSLGFCLAATQAVQGPVMIVDAQPNVAGL